VILVLSPSLVKQLISSIVPTSTPTAWSLICSHAKSTTKHFLLWLLTYWLKIHHIHETKHCWMLTDRSLQNLYQGCTVKMMQLVDTVYHALSCLPWSRSIQGFSKTSETVQLYKYTTTSWLSSIHENQMLDLLQEDLVNHNSG
jgi:hypothetical protein